MYKGVSDSESSIIKKFEQKLDQARTNEVTLNQTIKDLQNQIHEFDLVAKEQTESYSAGMRQATQQAVEAQVLFLLHSIPQKEVKKVILNILIRL